MRACDPPSLQIALSWGWHSSNTSTETIASVTLGRRTVLASVFEGGFSGPFGVLLPNAPPLVGARRCLCIGLRAGASQRIGGFLS